MEQDDWFTDMVRLGFAVVLITAVMGITAMWFWLWGWI